MLKIRRKVFNIKHKIVNKNALAYMVSTRIRVEEPEDELPGLVNAGIDVILALNRFTEVSVRVGKQMARQVLGKFNCSENND